MLFGIVALFPFILRFYPKTLNLEFDTFFRPFSDVRILLLLIGQPDLLLLIS